MRPYQDQQLELKMETDLHQMGKQSCLTAYFVKNFTLNILEGHCAEQMLEYHERGL